MLIKNNIEKEFIEIINFLFFELFDIYRVNCIDIKHTRKLTAFLLYALFCDQCPPPPLRTKPVTTNPRVRAA